MAATISKSTLSVSFPPTPLEIVLLEGAEELDLHEGEFPHLVQEQRAAVGCLKRPSRARLRP